MLKAYTHTERAHSWLADHRELRPVFACVLGFTATGLIPGISAAGATSEDRAITAIADAEFLALGENPHFPLPPLVAGASPASISRAVVAALHLPLYLFDAGLPTPLTVPAIAMGGRPAACLSTGQAMPLDVVKQLFATGMQWGDKLAEAGAYVILGECVVGGTTTALAVLTALGIDARNKVNSSHPACNHAQKWEVVRQGLDRASLHGIVPPDMPWAIAAAVGDPMQIAVAGMAIAASRRCGVLLAGGTQMLAVYALARAIACQNDLPWQPERIVVGTTRWVADDTTGDTVGLAALVGEVPLIATQLHFADSRFAQLRAYEEGFVKEGVGAGGAAIAAHLYQGWSQARLLQEIEAIAGRLF